MRYHVMQRSAQNHYEGEAATKILNHPQTKSLSRNTNTNSEERSRSLAVDCDIKYQVTGSKDQEPDHWVHENGSRFGHSYSSICHYSYSHGDRYGGYSDSNYSSPYICIYVSMCTVKWYLLCLCPYVVQNLCDVSIRLLTFQAAGV